MREYAGRFGMSKDVLDDGFSKLDTLKGRLSASRIDELKELIRSGEMATAVRILLVEYYDPLYDKEIKRHEPFQLTVSGDAPSDAAADIKAWCKTKLQRASR
jgi:hypothetical protein